MLERNDRIQGEVEGSQSIRDRSMDAAVFFYMEGEEWTKVPTARLNHASPQAVCRDVRLMQLSP